MLAALDSVLSKGNEPPEPASPPATEDRWSFPEAVGTREMSATSRQGLPGRVRHLLETAISPALASSRSRKAGGADVQSSTPAARRAGDDDIPQDPLEAFESERPAARAVPDLASPPVRTHRAFKSPAAARVTQDESQRTSSPLPASVSPILPVRTALPGLANTIAEEATAARSADWRSEAPAQVSIAPAARFDRETPHRLRPQLRRVVLAVRRALTRRPAARSAEAKPATSVASITERLIVVGLVLLGLAEVVAVGWYLLGRASSVGSGSLTVTSRPAGALFLIDGELLGVTPATVRVREGVHALEIRSGGPTQIMALNVEKGGQVSRFFDLPVGTAAAKLRVETKPPGARVVMDGRARGRSPIVIADLNPGPHVLRVERGPQSLERAVMLEPGGTASLILPLEPLSEPTAGSGWLAVSVPIEIYAYEQARLVGTSRAGPWQLTAGRHDLELVNELLGVHVRKIVDLPAGRTVTLDVTVPSELVSITTSPPAVIHIDGESIGMAPIVNHRLVVGQHDVVAQHPELGERRLSVTVAARAPLSVNLDMRR